MTELGPALGRFCFLAVCTLILVFLVVPTILVIPMSFSNTSYLTFPPRGLTLRWYNEYLRNRDWLNATFFSLKIGALTTLCATIVGTLAAVAIVRGKVPGRKLIDGLVIAPLIVPHIILAVSIYQLFAGWRLNGSTAGFVLAHTVLATPYVIILVSAALRRIDPALDMAASNLGASPLRIFFTVILPLIRPALGAAMVFAFLSSFDEATVSFFISGIENKTITKKLFEDLDFSLSPLLAAVSTIFVIVTVGLTAGSRLFGRRTA